MATDMKEKFKIKNYVKLICLRLDHYESFIEDEVNTDCISDINDFILKHKNEEGVKILIFEMKNMRMTTISQAREYIQHLHAFDYIRGLIESGHDLITYKNVRSYFSAGHGVENYNLVSVRQKLTETYIYRVMAQHKTTGKYAVWTCWNETTQLLNFGHYDLTKETAIDILYCKGEWKI